MAKVNLGFDEQRLLGVINAVREDPDRGKTVWKAESHWKQGFQSEALIPKAGGGTHAIPMDEPEGLGGTGTAPNMVEQVLGAYGCCLITGYVAQAGLRGIELKGVDVEVEGDIDLRGFFGLSEEVSPGYSEVRTRVKLDAPGATPEQIKEIHDAVHATSPVGNALSRPVQLKTELIV